MKVHSVPGAWRCRAHARASERRAKRRVPSSGGGALRVIRTVNLGETKREGEVPCWDERAGARARSSARKTWSGNTIDERSIARSAHPRHLETSLSSSSSPLSFSLIGYRLLPLLLQLPHLSRRVSFHLFELLRDSYVTYRVYSSTCILLCKKFKLSINFHQPTARRASKLAIPILIINSLS